MSSATRVPVPTANSAPRPPAATRRFGNRTALLAKETVVRFRYGDGFSHARALAFQLFLSVIPLVIALVGVSDTQHTERAAEVVRQTLVALAPGGSQEALRNALADSMQHDDRAELAVWLGLGVAMVALTGAMGEVERGANRIYGVERDRPGVQKYVRALLLAFGAGVPALAGFVIVAAGPAAGEAIHDVYGIDRTLVAVLRWPVGVALMLAAVTVLMREAPRRRRRPGWSSVALGAAVALVLWLVFTGLLGAYVEHSASFGEAYGRLTGIVALLLWAQLTSAALFLGTALAAQLEAARAGVHRGARTDPEMDQREPASTESVRCVHNCESMPNRDRYGSTSSALAGDQTRLLSARRSTDRQTTVTHPRVR